MDEIEGLVLDASALLAYLQGEPGSEIVQAALAAGAVISIVNYAEVLSRLGDAGEDPVVAHQHLQEQGLIGGLLEIVPLTEDDAVAIARLRAATRGQGLSLGDRACLATGLRLGRAVLTADRSWAAVDSGIPVRVIRP
ncbi:type II toxin-antitoxin system VapC family toxin [Thermomicrobiaceae bacterium CFH 74404]|uniref:Ribonuclease VapC n=1 Tax=Thermalbibacter longus TaxID=2951981 RepID=A0AA42BAC1_9BACT|nr:type II toxin-antitoxin system VapC family toxin [Thermalbibacter longus]MCM8749537.1 type II toxin-antitoxin system VapC family toxin [Thermalbibacter longus]